MPKKKLAQPRIFFGILEFHLSLEFTLAFNQDIMKVSLWLKSVFFSFSIR